jgi:dimeric dUTPase (all-alpha-NTP-PPase superfamily)
MDKLEEMFQLQEQLNMRCGVNTHNLSREEKIEWLLKFSRALQQELCELVDATPWKWWKKQQQFDEESAKMEIIDLFHFLISMCKVLGMDAKDLFLIYLEKNKINHHRQDTGY